jgi:hypothetical protein
MLDLFLIAGLGFLGSFAHCVGMCGPITVAFSFSDQTTEPPAWQQQIWFHSLLNLGRIFSYALVGAGIGALGSVLIAGGQMAGIGSLLRRGMAILTGSLLIWAGLAQVQPGLLPHIPLLHPLLQSKLHHRLTSGMVKLSLRSHWWTPALLGMVWGLIPCGFLYAAQLKAAQTGNLWMGCATMLAFGLGTLPSMLAVGISTSLFSGDRRSQLFRMGGWLTIIIGVLTLLRTGDEMTDYTGHASLICLMLALAARPISRIWSTPLRYRRVLGVGAFILAIAHTLHMLAHNLGWNLASLAFMLPQHRWSIVGGAIALLFMAPAAFTSFDWAQKQLGTLWRRLHLLAVPALWLATLHTIGLGSYYLGGFQITWVNYLSTSLLGLLVLGIWGMRHRWFWQVLSLEKGYAPPKER